MTPIEFTLEDKSLEDLFFKDRGLDGVQLVTSDAHCGIQNAIREKFPGSAWQRCQMHFSRNILDACPNRLMPELKIEPRDMYEAPSLEECKRRRDLIFDKYDDLVPKAMKILDEGWTDITAVYSLPPSLRKKLRISNDVERVNAELKRRSSVLRIFTNAASILRLMGSIHIEMHEKWSERSI